MLAKRACGEITLLEQQELTSLIESKESFADLARALDVLNATDRDARHTDDNYFEQCWSSLEGKLKADLPLKLAYRKNRLRLMKPLLAAACILAVIITGVLFLKQETAVADAGKDNIVSTKKGSKSYTVLPDGTQVWLNSDTKISYGKSFGSGSREVTLTGEAYFDVVKDPSRPFIVHTSAMDIKVLGTAFNVSAYENDTYTEATLIHGAVEVSLHKYQDKKVMLRPFEKVSVQNVLNTAVQKKLARAPEEQVFTLSKINKAALDSGAAETQWVKNRLVFTDNTLEEIAARLARWYDVNITITDSALKQTRYSAGLDDVTLEQVMQSLKLTGGFNYSINNKNVIIYP